MLLRHTQTFSQSLPRPVLPGSRSMSMRLLLTTSTSIAPRLSNTRPASSVLWLHSRSVLRFSLLLVTVTVRALQLLLPPPALKLWAWTCAVVLFPRPLPWICPRLPSLRASLMAVTFGAPTSIAQLRASMTRRHFTPHPWPLPLLLRFSTSRTTPRSKSGTIPCSTRTSTHGWPSLTRRLPRL